MTSEPLAANQKLDGLRPLLNQATLPERVRDAIKAYIVSQNLQPGDMLPSERQLSEALAVSRNVVREGLSALVAEGLLVKQPGKGIFLRELDAATLYRDGTRVLSEEQARYQTIREARAAVELGAIGLIINRITGQDLQELEHITNALEAKLERGEPFFQEDMQFHVRLLRVARNDILLQWTPLVEEVMRGWAYQPDSSPWVVMPAAHIDDGRRVAREHRAILDAIRQRDVHEARRRLRQHFLIPDL